MKHAKNCAVYRMLKGQKRHLSFHTPGHKRAGYDITELPYSDNLYAPSGVIAQAENECARILGAYRTFFLTDGSTAGVHAMLYAVKKAGCKSVAVSVYSHASVKTGCALAGLEIVAISAETKAGIPLQPTEEQICEALKRADALLLTSPDYYGNFPPLSRAKALCKELGKPLLIDGAHGAHLHFTEYYAGRYADLWVDGLHKSLPALTQGAAVSAKNEKFSALLQEGVRVFRTTSPSYPILASCEYAIRYPRNEKIEELAQKLKEEVGAYANADWSKVLVPFGEHSEAAEKYLNDCGIYSEFNDGNYSMFYLSPATGAGALKKLARVLKKLPRSKIEEDEQRGESSERTEFILLAHAEGRVCACECGLFPPCVPLLLKGSVITKSKLNRLARAEHTFGLRDGKIEVYL